MAGVLTGNSETACSAWTVGKLRYRGGSPCKSIVRNPWRETDPNRRSSSSNDRHDNELRTFETLCEADARSIGKGPFGQGSWLMLWRSQTKGLKNGHFPSHQIQIVPDSNCCKLFMDNRLPAETNFSPDTSEYMYEKAPGCSTSKLTSSLWISRIISRRCLRFISCQWRCGGWLVVLVVSIVFSRGLDFMLTIRTSAPPSGPRA